MVLPPAIPRALSITVVPGAVAVAVLVVGVSPGSAPAFGALAVAGAAYGVWSNGRHHDPRWRAAWAALGLGLLWEVVGLLVRGPGAPSARPSTAVVVLFVGGAVLAVGGLYSLIGLRHRGRAVEALAEGTIGALALGLSVLALILVPAHGWQPDRDLPALGVLVVEFVALWLAASLVSLTPRDPVGYRYLIAGLAFLLIASGATWFPWSDSPSTTSAVYALALGGACLWSFALLHRSQRGGFDPVPARSARPSVAHVAVLFAGTVVVPAVLVARFLGTGQVRPPGLAAVELVLPLVIVAYLVHQVFAHAAAEYRAQHDPLTGICNRTLFEDRVKTSLAMTEQSGGAVGVMFLDLDRFKGINDSLGHAVGNQVLQAVVKRLQGCMRAQDTLARLGGDEFTVLLPGIGDKEQCARFAERTLAVFSEPITVGGRQLTVQASAGIAVYPEDAHDADSLLKSADMAMYQAKAAGRNTFEIYDSTLSVRAKLRFALEASLRTAVDSGRLAVHYQPKYITATGEIAGVEALARWHHPQLGFIPPWAFIPLAEESSLVETLGEWVLESACRQVQQWHEESLLCDPVDVSLLHVPVAVNMSARQIAHRSVVSMVSDVLARTDFDPRLLEIEVTESVLVEQMEDVTETIKELRALGVRCSIDDFGTGYSTLTYLAEFPVDAVKIDRSFVSRLGTDASAGAIVGAVIALAHSLDIEVVAEGVETEVQLHFLDQAGCDQVQGFLFSPAVPADEFARLVHDPVGLGAANVSGGDWIATPPSVLSQSRLAAVLDSLGNGLDRSRELDSEGIESVLAVLHGEDPVVPTGARRFGFLRARPSSDPPASGRPPSVRPPSDREPSDRARSGLGPLPGELVPGMQ